MPAERSTATTSSHLCRAHARRSSPTFGPGEGPWFFEVMTYRWREHVGPGDDYHLGYRTEDEARPWMADRPGARAWPTMVEPARASTHRGRGRGGDRRGLRLRRGQPVPRGRGTVRRDVFKERLTNAAVLVEHARSRCDALSLARHDTQLVETRTLSYVEAVREATDQEMARDPSVIALRPGRGRSQGDPGHDARPAWRSTAPSASSARRCPRTP